MVPRAGSPRPRDALAFLRRGRCLSSRAAASSGSRENGWSRIRTDHVLCGYLGILASWPASPCRLA